MAEEVESCSAVHLSDYGVLQRGLVLAGATRGAATPASAPGPPFSERTSSNGTLRALCAQVGRGTPVSGALRRKAAIRVDAVGELVGIGLQEWLGRHREGRPGGWRTRVRRPR